MSKGIGGKNQKRFTDEEMGAIALAYVRNRVKKSDILHANPNSARREIGNTAKELGIPYEKCAQFIEQILQDVVIDISLALK
ncbi:MAG: hypothetical protein HZB12_00375 [Candidatus Yonathbacteria bacterium]|nr:hypothetical protein [Candidatus Yonathbacteria bacterium]